MEMFLVFAIVGNISGILCNIFVAGASAKNGQKKKLFQRPGDFILFLLGSTNTIILCFQFLLDISDWIWVDLFESFNICAIIINGLYGIFLFFTTCLTSWLCCFYCIKIVSFQNKFLVMLKANLVTLLPWMVAGTLMVSGLLLVTMVGVFFVSVSMNTTNLSMSLCPEISDSDEYKPYLIVFCFGLVTVLPFLLIVVSLSSTLQSLVHHVRTSVHLDNSHLRAHIKASKTMVLLLVLSVSFYLSQLFLGWDLALFSPALYWICLSMYYLFWPLQTLILIFTNKRLKNICVCFFCRVHTHSNVPGE